ncbi:MAG TPA: hypothetical protein VNU00_02925, partial [Candidatus Binataceae bacterium]|nr:hypothetical protein [Candidatus Binataceae bacterium]
MPATTNAIGQWAVPNRPPTPIKSMRARPWLVVSIGTIVAIFGLVIALLYGEPSYFAEATVRVSLSSAAPLDPNEARMDAITYRDFVQQQVYEIGKYSTVKAALERLGPTERAMVQRVGESDRFAAERLMRLLKVTPLTDSYFITVSLEGDNPQGLAEIVNAVVNTYLEREASQEQNGTDESVQLLTSRKGQLKQSMTTDREQLDEILHTLGIASIDGKLANPYEKLLADENSALGRAHRAVLLAQARLNAVKGHQQQLEDLQVNSKAQEMLTNNPETTPAKSQLMEQREAAFLELSSLGPSHPARPALEQKIAEINSELKKLDAAALEKIQASLRTSEGAKSDATV